MKIIEKIKNSIGKVSATFVIGGEVVEETKIADNVTTKTITFNDLSVGTLFELNGEVKNKDTTD